MFEAATLEKAKPAVPSLELNGFEAYMTPKDLESALPGFRGTASTAPNLPDIELTDGSGNPVVNQQSREIHPTQVRQAGNEKTEPPSADTRAESWLERGWSRMGLREEILCAEIKRTLGVNCSTLKKGQ